MRNKAFLIGHVGQDPEITAVGDVNVAKFSLATSDRPYTNKQGERVEGKTQWHNIVAWRGLADTISKYVKKGDRIGIMGKIEYSSYENKEGHTVYRTEILAQGLEFLSNKTDIQSGGNDAPF